KHLLEMRHEPALVDRVPRKAAAEVIVDAALADMGERDIDGGKVAGLAGAHTATPQQLEKRSLRKLRCSARSPIHRIDQAAELARGVVEFGNADGGGPRRPRLVGEARHERGAVLLDLLRLFAKQPR